MINSEVPDEQLKNQLLVHTTLSEIWMLEGCICHFIYKELTMTLLSRLGTIETVWKIFTLVKQVFEKSLQ